MNIITFGTFDLIHIGHLNILTRAKALGNVLTVGVSSDELNYSKKGKYPISNECDRMAIIKSIRVVDHVFLEESLELKREYIQTHQADVLVMGDDWKGKFDDLQDICKVTYLSRTPAISTTSIIEKVISK